jgi:hypothetical protein
MKSKVTLRIDADLVREARAAAPAARRRVESGT